MVNYCRVLGFHREKDLHFYRLPQVSTNQGEDGQNIPENRRRLWLVKLNQDFSGKNVDNIRVCSAHFISGNISFKSKSVNINKTKSSILAKIFNINFC